MCTFHQTHRPYINESRMKEQQGNCAGSMLPDASKKPSGSLLLCPAVLLARRCVFKSPGVTNVS